MRWTNRQHLHGADEDAYETGYHLVQNDGSNLDYRGENLLDTVSDGACHMGLDIRDGQFLNEDGIRMRLSSRPPHG